MTLTIALVVFMAALPPLVPRWTPGAMLVIVTLGVLCTAVLIAMWSRRYGGTALRVAAGGVAGIFVLAAADQLTAAITTRQPIIGGNTPIVGLFFIGIPCAIFSVRGFRNDPYLDLDLGDDGEDDFDDEFDDLDDVETTDSGRG
ncbi:MAG: hypothetical protein AAGB48_06365 [Planctomycetota bacterium]